MYKYVKSDVDTEEVSFEGLSSLWDTASGKNDIVQTVQSMNSREIVQALEDGLDEDVYRQVMITLAQYGMEG